MKTLSKYMATSATLALAMGCAQTVYAQEQANASSNTIIVTARKVEENTQDIPIAITAFTAKEMQRRSISELEDVALQTPGLVFEDYSNGGFGTPTIRGATQFAITALEQNVSVFMDGVYIPRQYAFDVGSMNLERIEVVKGPQSALYGANAFAGAINYVSTTRSLTDISASGELEVSENGGFDISGKLSVPLIEDVISMRLAMGYSSFGGDWENNHPDANAGVSPGSNGNVGGYERSSIQAGVSFKPFSALTIDFDYYNFKTDSETRAQYRLSRGSGDFNCSDGGQFFAPGNQLFCGQLSSIPSPGPSGVEGIVIDPRTYGIDSESDIARLNVALDITDQISVNYMFAHTNGNVFSAGQSERDSLVGTVSGGQTFNAFSLVPIGNYNYDTHEVRLQYVGDTGIYAMVGAFFMDGDDVDVGTGGFAPFRGLEPITTILGGARPVAAFTTTETTAIFGRVAIPLMNERLTIELEGRYTDESKPTRDGVRNEEFEFNDSYFTPRGSLSYKVTDDNLLYASVAKGVKSGGVNISNFALNADERFFGPDTNWTYEIGMKNTFMDGRGTLNLAAFYIDWSSLQLQISPEGASFFTTNIIRELGGASSKGVELDGTFEVTEGLVVNGGLAFIDASYDEGVVSDRITRSNLCGDGLVCNANGDIGGNDLQRTSRFQWNVGASYERQLTNDIDLFSRLDVAGQSKQFVSEINATTIEPRALVNGRIGISGERWSASIWAKNLFDEQYVANAFFIATPFFTDYVPTLGNRRRVGATLTFDY